MTPKEEPQGRLDPSEPRLAAGSFSFAGGIAAVLLDRDGVISQQTAFVNRPEDLLLVDRAAEAIARLNRAGLPVVVVTNQGGIAMGYLTERDLVEIHEHMEQLLLEGGAHVDAIYYCPHHERATVAAYLLDCPCRKPGTGMLEKARDELGIDLRRSVLVGDATTDVLAGIRAGCRTILVQTGFGGKDGKAEATPDAVAADLPAAVDLILATADA
jgi:D-glycero-D-manno-heptose 1,7-bisphosphate phosphatase